MKTALLLLCVSFSSSSITQDSLFENTSSVWAETTREKKNNENAEIKSHKRASQTGNCGSVLVCNVKKGTLKLKKRHWHGNYVSIKYCKLFASVALWRTLWMLRANFRRT